jgi:hypothetical protein
MHIILMKEKIGNIKFSNCLCECYTYHSMKEKIGNINISNCLGKCYISIYERKDWQYQVL